MHIHNNVMLCHIVDYPCKRPPFMESDYQVSLNLSNCLDGNKTFEWLEKYDDNEKMIDDGLRYSNGCQIRFNCSNANETDTCLTNNTETCVEDDENFYYLTCKEYYISTPPPSEAPNISTTEASYISTTTESEEAQFRQDKQLIELHTHRQHIRYLKNQSEEQKINPWNEIPALEGVWISESGVIHNSTDDFSCEKRKNRVL